MPPPIKTIVVIVPIRLIQEIVLFLGCEVVFCSGLAAERLTVTDLLQVVEAAGDALVAVRVEGVEVDAGSAVDAGIYLASLKDRLTVCIYDAGRRSRVGIDEVGICVGRIIRSLQIAVTKRSLEDREGRNGLAITLQLALTFLIGCFDGCLDLVYSDGVGLGDDEAYAGCYFVNANSATAPGIVDADRNPILTRGEVYSGVYGRASISFYAFNSNGNKGIACGLNNLQKIRDGEPLGGKASAESDFDTEDDDDFLA